MPPSTPFPPGSLVAGYFRDSGGNEQDLSVFPFQLEIKKALEYPGPHIRQEVE